MYRLLGFDAGIPTVVYMADIIVNVKLAKNCSHIDISHGHIYTCSLSVCVCVCVRVRVRACGARMCEC